MNIERITDLDSLEEIFRTEFDSYPPSLTQGVVFAVKENDEIQGFITTETLIRVGMVWIHPQKRKTSFASRLLKTFYRFLVNNIPFNTSVVVIDDTSRYAKTLKLLGFRPVKGDIWRIDV